MCRCQLSGELGVLKLPRPLAEQRTTFTPTFRIIGDTEERAWVFYASGGGDPSKRFAPGFLVNTLPACRPRLSKLVSMRQNLMSWDITAILFWDVIGHSPVKMRISLHPRAAASLPRSRNAKKLEEKKLNLNDLF